MDKTFLSNKRRVNIPRIAQGDNLAYNPKMMVTDEGIDYCVEN